MKVHERRQGRLATSKYSSFPKGTLLSSETSLGRLHVTHVSCCNENGFEKSLLHVAPFSYRGPSSLPAPTLPAFSIFLSSGEGWTSFLSESMDGDGTWREDPLTSSVCSKNFLLRKSFLCMTIRLNFYSFSSSLFLKIFEPFQILLNISKRLHLDFQNFDFLQVSTKIR